MPYLDSISVSALGSSDPKEMIDSLVRQLNAWAAEISNEKIATVQRNPDGNVSIVQGSQTVNGVQIVGTLYYDTEGIDRIFVGLHPTDSHPGIWISEDGESIIGLLADE